MLEVLLAHYATSSVKGFCPDELERDRAGFQQQRPSDLGVYYTIVIIRSPLTSSCARATKNDHPIHKHISLEPKALKQWTAEAVPKQASL